MTPTKRFLHGGGGALMPVVVSLIALDIGSLLASGYEFSTAAIVGIGIRYVLLFLLGGVVAYLHSDEDKPFKLFELGIAAPALVTSLVTAQGLSATHDAPSIDTSWNFSIISQAHANESSSYEQVITTEIVTAGLFKDLLDGATGRIYQSQGSKQVEAKVAEVKTKPVPAAKPVPVIKPKPVLIEPPIAVEEISKLEVESKSSTEFDKAELRLKELELKLRLAQEKNAALQLQLEEKN